MPKKCLRIFVASYLLILLLSNIAYSQNIPEYYRKTVVFISHDDALGKEQKLGTGFFFLTLDSPYVMLYLVTAKHVITDTATKKPYSNVSISYNVTNKSKSSFQLNFESKNRNSYLFYHQDTSVDLVVMALQSSLIPDTSDIRASTTGDLFKSKLDFDTSYIDPGTNIFYTGMFTPYVGYNKNYPITRFGKVSLLTDEKIQFDEKEPKSMLILAETTTFGGNSGSPVFAYGSVYKITSSDTGDKKISKEQNHVPIYMLGIMKGYFEEKSVIGFQLTSNMAPTYSNNIGVAAIIPSYHLYEIIEGESMKRFRKKILTEKR